MVAGAGVVLGEGRVVSCVQVWVWLRVGGVVVVIVAQEVDGSEDRLEDQRQT